MVVNKKGFGVLALVIAAAVALVVGVLVGPSFGGAQLSPFLPSTGDGSPIKAHSCDADSVCEINAAQIDDVNIGGRTITTLDNNHGLFLSSAAGFVDVESDLIVEGRLRLGADSIECDSFPRNGTRSGDETCLGNGYDYCLVAEYTSKTTYHDSTNTSCDGEVQTTFKTLSLNNCPGQGGGGGGGCALNQQGAEPYYGDISTSFSSAEGTNIICCR